ncbi:ATP-dependent RNA helicase DDX46/PRP5 [Monocercomonoides exilis]|uniref:ATP-dependent RNA helicase DDX46/PRP5 n=1 Tax=Monocercomonoides exilis TaxID=2049356 RepID=UPI00355AB8F1|nr:ATP-dependent RNA helicase DDX46/PRP5 [Monocercomonoides exilis]|eukprot:MONOS_2467.1-p1 / transcript=MONOS_2467.1 / gene=MONOS_2467 / organism=Monocercomonoides_exilis_PA203 / gene_product=GM20179 / transcript_product=GM20179 / location=Mono_scaffold00051:81074-84497(-) / protein_length=1103 / sequence_SO=supercontig / SO=protein_coding / is_pseudo=false
MTSNHLLDEDEGALFEVFDKTKKAPSENKRKHFDQPQVEQPPEEEDPLDAYMKTIYNETQGISTNTGKKQIQEEEEDKDFEASRGLPEMNELNALSSFASSFLPKEKRKILPEIDHSTIDYPPFEKNFYFDPPELAKLSKKEILERRQQLENIRVRGKDCPCPITSWVQTGLNSRVLEVIEKKLQFSQPTPIQAQVIPTAMKGKDVIGIAKTGSGKTMGFVLPMIRHVLAQPRCQPGEGPIALMIAPTRELCIQIWRDTRSVTSCIKMTGHGDGGGGGSSSGRGWGWSRSSMNGGNDERIRVVAVYGGATVNVSDQIAKLKSGAEVVVCTPGRMIELLALNGGKVTTLFRTTYVVLDEADRMMDLGFSPQITRLLQCIRPDRQTLMFSATFPRQLEAMAKNILTKPIEIIVGRKSSVCADVHQIIRIIRPDETKLEVLKEILFLWRKRAKEEERAGMFQQPGQPDQTNQPNQPASDASSSATTANTSAPSQQTQTQSLAPASSPTPAPITPALTPSTSAIFASLNASSTPTPTTASRTAIASTAPTPQPSASPSLSPSVVNLYDTPASHQGPILVFVKEQTDADKLFASLIECGFPCLPLHGGRDQADRDSAIGDFKEGNVPMLIATSVAARGLDVKGLSLVVNYDCPDHLEDYVHRVGRTGRAGQKGTAITFVHPESSGGDDDRYTPSLVKAIKQSAANVSVPEDLLQIAQSYLERVSSHLVAMPSSGFGGKGFKFDENEEKQKEVEKEMLRKRFRTGDDDDDGAGEGGMVEDDGDDDYERAERIAISHGLVPHVASHQSSSSSSTSASASSTAVGAGSGIGSATSAASSPSSSGASASGSIIPPSPSPTHSTTFLSLSPTPTSTPLLSTTPSHSSSSQGVTLFTPISSLSSAEAATVLRAKSKLTLTPDQIMRYIVKTMPLPLGPGETIQRVQCSTRDGLTFVVRKDATAEQRRAVLQSAMVAEAVRLEVMTGTLQTAKPAAAGAGGVAAAASHFCEEMEINDYPQMIRSALTNRTELASIMELTATSITPRGIYCEKNLKGISVAPPGQRKLFLAIEGDSAEKVRRAKAMLVQRMTDVKEEMMPVVGGVGQAHGRFKVVS